MGTGQARHQREPLMIAWVIWASLLLAVAAYYGLLGLLTGATSREAEELSDTFRGFTFSMAVCQTMLAYLAYRRIQTITGTSPEEGMSHLPESKPVLPLYVLCWGISESIAVVGLVVGILSRTMDAVTGFFVWSLLLLVAVHPRAVHFGRSSRSLAAPLG